MSELGKVTRYIDKIVIHHSASSWGNAGIVRKWHADRDFSDIGYHFVITNGMIRSDADYSVVLDGQIEVGRDVDKIGAHCLRHNETSIGICLIGNGSFTSFQLHSLRALVNLLIREFGGVEVFVHQSLADTKCPGATIEQLLGNCVS